jgi:hypothetical protein
MAQGEGRTHLHSGSESDPALCLHPYPTQKASLVQLELENGSKVVVLDKDGYCAALSGVVIAHGLPTSDPAVAGQLWNSAGTVKVSAG